MAPCVLVWPQDAGRRFNSCHESTVQGFDWPLQPWSRPRGSQQPVAHGVKLAMV